MILPIGASGTNEIQYIRVNTFQSYKYINRVHVGRDRGKQVAETYTKRELRQLQDRMEAMERNNSENTDNSDEKESSEDEREEVDEEVKVLKMLMKASNRPRVEVPMYEGILMLKNS